MHDGSLTGGPDVGGALMRVIRERRIADLATVVSAPPEANVRVGRKLLVEPDGSRYGSLGDSDLDSAVAGDAGEIIESRKSEVIGYPVAGAEVEVFHELLEPKPQLLIVGAGHIAVPLAKLGSMLGFEVIVLDDREKFANVERFPDASRVITADFGETLRDFYFTPSTYVVVITRAHTYDEEALRMILGKRVAYLGMIGSRRRVQTVLRILAGEGYDAAQLAEVRAPIGLDVAAETPEEIALSIIAEVVATRRGGTGVPLSRKGRPIAIETAGT